MPFQGHQQHHQAVGLLLPESHSRKCCWRRRGGQHSQAAVHRSHGPAVGSVLPRMPVHQHHQQKQRLHVPTKEQQKLGHAYVHFQPLEEMAARGPSSKRAPTPNNKYLPPVILHQACLTHDTGQSSIPPAVFLPWEHWCCVVRGHCCCWKRLVAALGGPRATGTPRPTLLPPPRSPVLAPETQSSLRLSRRGALSHHCLWAALSEECCHAAPV